VVGGDNKGTNYDSAVSDSSAYGWGGVGGRVAYTASHGGRVRTRDGEGEYERNWETDRYRG
jgi:hypothetical protein